MKKINKEMVEHLLRIHLEYETTKAKSNDMKNIFDLIKYLFTEIEELKRKCQEKK